MGRLLILHLLLLNLTLLVVPAWADPWFIACPTGPGRKIDGKLCGYYRTNAGDWNLLAMGEIGQTYCKTAQCPGVVTAVPPGSQAIIFTALSPLDTHGKPVAVKAENYSGDQWKLNASAARVDTSNPYTHGMLTQMWSAVLRSGGFFPNMALPYDKEFVGPNWRPGYARGESFLIETVSPSNPAVYVTTGPRAITVMVFPPGTFEEDQHGDLVVDAVLEAVPPYVKQTSHVFGVLALTGAPVTVVAADGFNASKNTCRQIPPGWTIGPDGGTANGGIERNVYTAYVEVSGVTELPVTFALCPGEAAYWAGAAVAYRRTAP